MYNIYIPDKTEQNNNKTKKHASHNILLTKLNVFLKFIRQVCILITYICIKDFFKCLNGHESC